MATERATIRLSDDWHADEPLAYLVKCASTTIEEYRVFADEQDAKDFAREQHDWAEEMQEDDEPVPDWLVYPLYAADGFPVP